jgi:hypothetical protein
MLLRPTALAVAAALSLGAPAAMADSHITPSAEVQPAAAVATPTQASQDDSSGYAKREQQNKQVANYKGGSVLVIGISGGALIVILILLLLLA